MGFLLFDDVMRSLETKSKMQNPGEFAYSNVSILERCFYHNLVKYKNHYVKRPLLTLTFLFKVGYRLKTLHHRDIQPYTTIQRLTLEQITVAQLEMASVTGKIVRLQKVDVLNGMIVNSFTNLINILQLLLETRFTGQEVMQMLLMKKEPSCGSSKVILML